MIDSHGVHNASVELERRIDSVVLEGVFSDAGEDFVVAVEDLDQLVVLKRNLAELAEVLLTQGGDLLAKGFPEVVLDFSHYNT